MAGSCISDEYEFAITDDHTEARRLGSKFPDLLLYPKGAVTITAGYAKARLERAELFIEVKATSAQDPFNDFPKSATSNAPVDPGRPVRADHQFLKQGADDIHKRRGQLIAYAADACAKQHRHSYFSLLICQDRARFFFWDRSGAIVSEGFDYTTVDGSEILAQFLWRYTHSAPFERGWDPTIVVSSKADHEAFGSHPSLKDWYEEDYVVTVLVWDKVDEKYKSFLVSRPVVSPLSMAGRATRGYWALDKATNKIVFIKDTWRSHTIGTEPEGDTLKKLHKNGVRNIPEFYCHGDVPTYDHKFQLTITHRYSHFFCGNPDDCQVFPLVHYRVVSKTVGRILIDACESSLDLLTVTRDAFQGKPPPYVMSSCVSFLIRTHVYASPL